MVNLSTSPDERLKDEVQTKMFATAQRTYIFFRIGLFKRLSQLSRVVHDAFPVVLVMGIKILGIHYRVFLNSSLPFERLFYFFQQLLFVIAKVYVIVHKVATMLAKFAIAFPLATVLPLQRDETFSTHVRNCQQKLLEV